MAKIRIPLTGLQPARGVVHCFLGLFCLFVSSVPSFGRELCPGEAQNAAGNLSRLLLHAKHPGSWKVVDGGAWAEIQFERSSGTFTVKGIGLASDTTYVLARVNVTFRSGQFIGAARTDRQGNLAFAGRWRNWHGTFWLVDAADIRGEPCRAAIGSWLKLKAWNPSAYLFESEVLR